MGKTTDLGDVYEKSAGLVIDRPSMFPTILRDKRYKFHKTKKLNTTKCVVSQIYSGLQDVHSQIFVNRWK